ncbi:hypothetical protein F4809DRAFT_642954 [Biscogniauxia mediterranea]|nr:hypothetical protein F4809DRAFT_642954 [Biscogniauxia mediterranea]
MGSLIQIMPCMVTNYSFTRYLHPWRGYLGRDRGMILFLNQDECGFFIPPRWGRYTNMIQYKRKTAMILRHDTYIEDEDMILINPKRVPTKGTFQYRSSATNLPYDKITRLALAIGERSLTQWAYKWLDLHLSSMKNLEEVLFIDTNALSYLQNVIVDLTNGEPGDEAADDWEDRSWSADLLKTYSPAPPGWIRSDVRVRPETKCVQYVPQQDAVLTSTHDGARNWGWIPAGPDGMSLIEMPEYSKLMHTIHQRQKPIAVGYMIHAVSQETASILKLIKWLDSI